MPQTIKPRYYSNCNVVYDREWFPKIKDTPPPAFTLCHCRNAKVAALLAKTLNRINVEEFERKLAAETPAFED